MPAYRRLRILLLTGSLATVATAGPLGTAFTFQGQLKQDGTPFSGTANLRFELYADPNSASPLAFYPDPNVPPGTVAVDVTNGLFTQAIDFGQDVFTGDARWLQVYVEGTALLPRQPLTPAPAALALPGLWTRQNATSPNLIGGYAGNAVAASAVGATIGGGGYAGAENRVFDNYGAVTGGIANRAGSDDGNPTNAQYATVVGGHSNTATGFRSVVIGGGYNNTTNGTIIGGSGNNATGAASIIIGSTDSTASGTVSSVVGGQNNAAAGPYSLAAGYRAKANHDGALVFSDHSEADFASTAANQFLVRATGGVGIGTNAPTDPLTVNGVVRSMSGGFEFPDGTTQTTAAAVNPSTWQLNGTSVYYNAGKVGIGTNLPGSLLELEGNDPDIALDVAANSASYPQLRFKVEGVDQAEVAYVKDAQQVEITNRVSGAKKIVLEANGNVGIGTGDPVTALHVGDGDVTTQDFEASPAYIGRRAHGTAAAPTPVEADDALVELFGAGYDGTSYTTEGWFGINAAETWDPTGHGTYMRFVTTNINSLASYERMRIAPNGYVQIGAPIASDPMPSGMLHLRDGDLWIEDYSSPATVLCRRAEGTSAAPTAVTSGLALGEFTARGHDGAAFSNNQGYMSINAAENWNPNGHGTTIRFGTTAAGTTNQVERVRIDADGDVGIGTTSPAAKLDVNGTTRTQVLEVTGADVAEKFPVSDKVEPGLVVEIDPENAGQLRLARGAYNRRVAGVVSGAGGLAAGAVLGNLPGHEDAPPIALSGRVWVRCDASNGAIQPGDLLTTSDTPGHAMKVTDYPRAQGAIIGKAMTALAEGERGLVLVLVSLQ